MQRLGQLVLSLALSFGLASSAHAAEWTKVRIGTEGANPPFNFIDASGKLQGFDIDIAKALCERMKVECEFVTQDWDGMIPALQAKRYDAIVASMSITEERKQSVAFTNKYYSVPSKFVVRKEAGIDDVSAEGLSGKTIGAQSSTTESAYLEKAYPSASIKLYPTMDDAIADLAAGRIEAVLGGAITLSDWLASPDRGGACCAFAGPDLKDPAVFGEGAGIAIRKDDTDLVAKFNAALQEILADGTYKKVNDKYFKVSIY